jgi:hypothetical protein
MSIFSTLPKDWIDVKIEDKLLFFNIKEKLVSYHPPMDLKNISTFLNLYKINKKKGDILKLLQISKSITVSKDTKHTKFDENKKESYKGITMDIDYNNNSDQPSNSSKPVKPTFDKDPITDGNILIIFIKKFRT